VPISLENKIINKLQDFYKIKTVYPLHEPLIEKDDQKNVIESVKSTYVSTVGPLIGKFEFEIAKYCGSKYAVATNSGTSALHLSLLALGVKKKDEVLVPAFTFVGTVNSIAYCDAIPHFIDSSIEKKGVDVNKLEIYLKRITVRKGKFIYNKNTGNRIKAIIPVHIFGHPCEIDKILVLAKKYNLIVLEDAAESLGSRYKNKHCGTFGNVGCLSFNGNKIITSGSGGAVLTNSKKIATKIKHLSMVAKKRHKWSFIHDEVGFNYKLTNLNASLGLSQLKKIEKFLIAKRKLFNIYNQVFSSLTQYLDVLKEPNLSRSNYWLQNIILKKPNAYRKNKILQKLNDNNIFARPAWMLMSDLKPFKKYPKMDLTGSKIFFNSVISIPSSQSILLKKLHK
tara:strand:+ start:4532 stop:5716 length:1185 start_codon:yes stop_codon:yes gene_type:complete